MPESPATPRVLFAVENSIAQITLDNPDRKGAITIRMATQIAEYCDRIERDESIGAAVVASRGRYFCSGADTRDLAISSADPASSEAVARVSAVYGAFVRIGNLPVPTVSAVVGGAVGAGLNLALATDVMLVTPDAVLDSGFLARHIHPGGGHLALLGRAVGRQQALAMGVLGAALSGTDAVRRGLAWDTTGPDEILGKAIELVSIAAQDPVLARRIKNSARLELDPPGVPWPAAVEIERGVQMWSMGRKGETAWNTKPNKPSVAGGHA
ncbi:enoyl-CoA hydratase [Rhodococcus sp. OK519]|uniref:enoyl-CoA hydratase-related protein n=1 Tax=Rhodococcus sp. OK519 TaxID=2135729 RepID=UPI000D3B6AEF|nr:enoyl-CoA hydratase [Rhodococcus sp. OK519]